MCHLGSGITYAGSINVHVLQVPGNYKESLKERKNEHKTKQKNFRSKQELNLRSFTRSFSDTQCTRDSPFVEFD